MKSNAARLERIAASSKPSQAQIVKLKSKDGIETYRWLCLTALERWIGKGWSVLDSREPGHNLHCDDHAPCITDDEIPF